MTARLSNIDDVRRALINSQGEPVEIVDEQTNTIYVMVTREDFQNRYQPSYDESEPDPKEFYPLVDESFGGPGGWDAPGMELYDNYDEHRP